MRITVIATLLTACAAAPPADRPDDPPHDTSAATGTDSDSDSDVRTDSDETDASTCIGPVLQDTGGRRPWSFDEAEAFAEHACVYTEACEDGHPAAVVMTHTTCASSTELWFDDAGARIATRSFSDVGACAEGYWHGGPLPACRTDGAPARFSAGCVSRRIADPPTAGCVGAGAPTPRVTPLTPWGSLDAMAAAVCVGRATCQLDGRTLDLVTDADGCLSDEVDVWEQGTLVATLVHGGLGCGPRSQWIGQDLTPCTTVTFTPSAGCGIAGQSP